MPANEHPDDEYTMLVDKRPDGQAVPFLRKTYYLVPGGFPEERDLDVLGESYEVLGQVTDYDPTEGLSLQWPTFPVSSQS